MILVYYSLSLLAAPWSVCWAAAFSTCILFSLSSLQQEALKGNSTQGNVPLFKKFLRYRRSWEELEEQLVHF